VHALLKDALLEAATLEGGKGGLVAYLRKQARDNPAPFLALLGKVLPLQITGKVKGAVQTIHSTMTEKQAIEAYAAAIRGDTVELTEHVPEFLSLTKNDQI
jgi:hypothetical protein